VCVNTEQSRRWWSSVHSAMSTRYMTLGVAAVSSRLTVRLPDHVPVSLDTASSSLIVPPLIRPSAAPYVKVNVLHTTIKRTFNVSVTTDVRMNTDTRSEKIISRSIYYWPAYI